MPPAAGSALLGDEEELLVPSSLVLFAPPFALLRNGALALSSALGATDSASETTCWFVWLLAAGTRSMLVAVPATATQQRMSIDRAEICNNKNDKRCHHRGSKAHRESEYGTTIGYNV
jgi:hypothetical protein